MIQNKNDWVQILKQKSKDFSHIKESEILVNIPSELYDDWDNFMRGRTCPLLENGDHGIYSWDLTQFLNKFQND
jgi:hypothetical protein